MKEWGVGKEKGLKIREMGWRSRVLGRGSRDGGAGVLGRRSGCQGNPRAHCMSPHQSAARNEDSAPTLLVLTPAEGVRQGLSLLPFLRPPLTPSSSSQWYLEWLGGAVTWERIQPLSPLTGMLPFSIFPGSRELSPFPEPDLTHPGQERVCEWWPRMLLGLISGTQ